MRKPIIVGNWKMNKTTQKQKLSLKLLMQLLQAKMLLMELDVHLQI